jgi:Zn-dependent protease
VNETARCSSCGTEFPQGRLICPACHALVHADELRRLAEQAERDTREGRRAEALAAWRQALDLLPPASVQSKQIGERIAVLTRDGEPKAIGPIAADGGAGAGKSKGVWSGLAAGAVLVLAKLKWLLLGMSKAPVFLPMLLSLGVYWAAWGWWFAVGVMVSLYVHELGHVVAFHRIGIQASVPMFFPGFGAYVRGQRRPATLSDDAYVALAGPVWGTGAAVGCGLLWWASGYGLWGALTEWVAAINLLNLIPIAFLDGGHAVRALSRRARWSLVFIGIGAFVATRSGTALLVTLVVLMRAFGGAPLENDRRATVTFAILIVSLALLSALPKWMGLDPRV